MDGMPPSGREAMGFDMIPGAGKSGRLVIFGGAGSSAGIYAGMRALVALLNVCCSHGQYSDFASFTDCQLSKRRMGAFEMILMTDQIYPPGL
jgi:hypothetical protein